MGNRLRTSVRRFCMAVIAVSLTSCVAHAEPPNVSKIVITLGQCGGVPCVAEQVAMINGGPYSYTIYPHRRVFAVTAPNFADVVRRLRDTPFFNEQRRDSSEHGNSSSLVAIFVETQHGSEQVSIDESNPHYAQYRALAEFVLQPIRANVAALRTREEEALRSSKDLLDVSVTHGPLGKCLFYVAQFTQPDHVNVRYALEPQIGTPLLQRFYKGSLPFETIQELVNYNKIASLYQDYPIMGDDFEAANVQLTYRSGQYRISGPQRQFWPESLTTFISSVDRAVAQRLPLCRATLRGSNVSLKRP